MFITSYFKDIGMSLIPLERHSQKDLTSTEKHKILIHPEMSVCILKGRISIPSIYMKIIESHHLVEFTRDGSFIKEYQKVNSSLIGMETLFICMMDTISAMISERPYKEEYSLFKALEVVKKMIKDDCNEEFKIVVKYFKSIFLIAKK